MNPPATMRAFLSGDSGSGKTTRAYNMFLSHFPRVIYIDLTGEWIDRADVTAFGVYEGIDAIRDIARQGKWSVTIGMDSTDEIDALVNWMIPVPDLSQSPILMLGGCVALVDEVDLWAGPRTSSREARTLYRRSRHVGLSVVSTTQRPANVSREVSAQSTHVIAHRLSEPLDRDYVANLLRWDSVRLNQWIAWTAQYPHGAALVNLRTGALHWLPDSGAPVLDSHVQGQQSLPATLPQEQQLPPKIQPTTEAGTCEESETSLEKPLDAL